MDTRGYVALKELTVTGGAQSGGFDYLPARARNVRQALKDLPAINPADYTFVDLGSGKGRVLFLAAERSFHHIVGVELAVELHRAAQENIRRYRCARGRRPQIESINMDASDYIFPKGNLVIHLFNPFGPSVLFKVLENLQASAERNPRHIILVFVFPEFASLVETAPAFDPYRISRRYHIYQTKLRHSV